MCCELYTMASLITDILIFYKDKLKLTPRQILDFKFNLEVNLETHLKKLGTHELRIRAFKYCIDPEIIGAMFDARIAIAKAIACFPDYLTIYADICFEELYFSFNDHFKYHVPCKVHFPALYEGVITESRVCNSNTLISDNSGGSNVD